MEGLQSPDPSFQRVVTSWSKVVVPRGRRVRVLKETRRSKTSGLRSFDVSKDK